MQQHFSSGTFLDDEQGGSKMYFYIFYITYCMAGSNEVQGWV